MDPGPLGATISEALLSPLRYPLSPDQRLFWPFLLGALVLALAVLGATRRLTPRAVLGLVTPRVWLHRSSRLDVKLLFAKPLVRALGVAPWMFTAVSVATWVIGALDAWRGVPAPSALPAWLISALYTCVLFLCWDASRYVVHRLAHVVPPLWELHKVHHSAEVMTPLSIYRSHPLESLLFQLRGVAVTGLVSGVFFHLFRSSAVQAEILGVNAIGFVLNALGGNLRHSHVWLRYPRALEHVLISPAQHQLHHASVLAHCHSNYGSFLALWDWLGGSLRLSADHARPLRFGLPRHERNHAPASVVSALVSPVLAAARTCAPRALLSRGHRLHDAARDTSGGDDGRAHL